MTSSIEVKPMKYVRRDDVPEIFADAVANVNLTNGMTYVELGKTWVKDAGPPPALEQRTSGRLILGPGAVAQLLAALTAVAQQAQIATQAATFVPPTQTPPTKPAH